MMERYCFFLLFFFSKEDLINHSIQYVQRGAISRWYYSFFFFFFPFSKEPCNGGFISMHHFIFFIGRAYDFAVFFCAPLFFPFFFFSSSFLSRETQYFFYFFHSFLCIRARFNKQYALPLFSIQRFSTD